MLVHRWRGLELFDLFDDDQIFEDGGVRGEIGRFVDGVGNHAIRAVGEDDCGNVGSGGEGFQRGRDIGEAGERVVGGH